MDAREYMSRQGIASGRDPDRPNTLEEKAWERAREAGQHRPTTGTPHDWEDWERYHELLADDSASIEQKIDRQTHREQEQAPAADDRDAGQGGADARPASAAVEHFTPPARDTSSAHEASSGNNPNSGPATAAASVIEEPAVLRFAHAALAVFCPPLAVGLSGGGSQRVAVSLVLTLLLWVPGVIHAFIWLRSR